MKKKLSSLIFLGNLMSSSLYAGDLPVDWRHYREAAMGGAFSGVSNDAYAFFYNPAGLARAYNPRNKDFFKEIGFPELAIGGNTLMLEGISASLSSSVDTPSNVTDSLNVTNSWLNQNKFSRIIATALNNPESPLYGEFQLNSFFVMSEEGINYMIATPFRSELTIGVTDPQDLTKLTILTRTSLSIALAASGMSPGGSLSWGISLRPNYRYLYETDEWESQNVEFSNLTNAMTSQNGSSLGIPVDIGVQFLASDMWFPIFGLTIRNLPTGCAENAKNPVTQNSYTICGSLRSGNDLDSVDPTDIRFGMAMTPRFPFFGRERLNLRLSLDAYPIPISIGDKSYGYKDMPLSDLFHLGGEFFLGNALVDHGSAIRFGLHGTNITYGFSFDFGGFYISYASYLGYILQSDSDREEKRDRRHIIQLTGRW